MSSPASRRRRVRYRLLRRTFRHKAGSQLVRSAQVLVVNEELVQVWDGPDPSDAEEPEGRTRADPRDQRREVLALRESGPAPLGEPLEGARKNDARAGDEVAFSQHDVSGEIVRSPTFEERGNEGPELGEENAQPKPLLRIERGFRHRRTLPTPAPRRTAR